MHTAQQLKAEHFAIEIDGRAATRADLLTEWGPLHRLGVVVHEPFGAIGASYALQLAITAFYDARPERRSQERRVYADVFAFHVGGRNGSMVNFDVFPERKEVVVADEPIAILGAINNCGITHLLVPDRAAGAVEHEWKEPQQLRDRLVAAWAYSPSGRTSGADVGITASLPSVEANAKMTLRSPDAFHERRRALQHTGKLDIPDGEVMLPWIDNSGEVPREIAERVWDGRAALKSERGWTETYRRITADEALGMLHRGGGRAARRSRRP
jgi:hypothetical protein